MSISDGLALSPRFDTNVQKKLTILNTTPSFHSTELPTSWPKWNFAETASHAAKDVFVAPTAHLDHRSTVAKGSSIWYNAEVNGKC